MKNGTRRLVVVGMTLRLRKNRSTGGVSFDVQKTDSTMPLVIGDAGRRVHPVAPLDVGVEFLEVAAERRAIDRSHALDALRA